MSSSFGLLSSTRASTKRNPDAVSGVVGVPVTNLTGLHVLPAMPVTDEIVQRYSLKSPGETYVTFIEGVHDILEGDIMVIGSDEFKVKGSSPWPAHNYTEVVMDKVVGT